MLQTAVRWNVNPDYRHRSGRYQEAVRSRGLIGQAKGLLLGIVENVSHIACTRWRYDQQAKERPEVGKVRRRTRLTRDGWVP